MEPRSTRTLHQQFLLFLKGMAMGAADSVPGVSGGTIAFISGIYEELIGSIGSFNLGALHKLFSQGPLAAWRHVNGNFLLVLLSGILVSLYFFASSVEFLLEEYPGYLMAFFTGLILASCLYMFGKIDTWNFGLVLLVLAGIILSAGMSFLPQRDLQPGLVYLFFCGAIAICAMILPGISGAFILILLGAYQAVLSAVASLEFVTLLVFASGCACGLMVFSNFLGFLLSHFRRQTLSFLLGVLAGSLTIIWPTRQVINPASPSSDSVLLYLVLGLAGFLLVLGLEKFVRKEEIF